MRTAPDSRDMTLGIYPSAEADYLPLTRTKSGRLYRKHILTKGPLRHPATKQNVAVDDTFFTSLVENFNNKVCDIVQVPLAGPSNEHTEDPARNIGEVVGLELSGDKLFALIDARDEQYADKLGKTLLGASAMIHPNYEDAKTGKKVGPTLLHVCVTNRPYITELGDYEELIAATADNEGEAVMFTPDEEAAMTLEEMFEALKTEHGIDVPALQAAQEMALSRSQDEQSLVERLFEIVSEVPMELSGSDQSEIVLQAVQDVVTENLTLSAQVAEMEEQSRIQQVDALVEEGRILPAQREAFIELSATNPDLFEKMVPEEPLVALSNEEGTSFTDSRSEQFEDEVEAEIQRYTATDGPAVQAGYIK